MIKGTERKTDFEQLKYVGLFKGKVVAINPDAEEFEKIMGFAPKEDSKQFDYLSESDDGNARLRLDVWLEETKSRTRENGDVFHEKFKTTFFLEDATRVNKEGTNTQYINTVGVCSWADDPNNLPDWFKERSYREAYVGEEQLYGFIRMWLGKLDYRNEETVLELDWRKLMKGNVKELTDQINGEWCDDVVCLATVEAVEKDEGIVEYQRVYNRAFLPAYTIKYFGNIDYTDPEVIEKLKSKKRRNLKIYEKFVLDVTDEEYGCKDYYILKNMEVYDANTNLASSEKIISQEGADY